MSEKAVANVAHSVHDRLLQLARVRQEDFNLLLTQYALERLLYRLSVSSHRNEFILKGAMLFRIWAEQPHRPTRDLDLLGSGDHSAARVSRIFAELCSSAVEDDGLRFDAQTVRSDVLKPGEEYEGVRLRLRAWLGRSPIVLRIDVGYGDAVTPAPIDSAYPALLDYPAPQIRTYPRETVVAEKLEAMVRLGITNSRMKDFFDVWILSRRFRFEGVTLSAAIGATFARRRTPSPAHTPLALTAAFSWDAAKRMQWQAFLRKGYLTEAPPDFTATIHDVSEFLSPPLTAARDGNPFVSVWEAGGPWLES
ncbi:MAG: nucleotidyl transferase AbiEii/AbiGii toxin family protein [Dehalococcoidia bacterium]